MRVLFAVIAVAVVWYVFIRPGSDELSGPEQVELLRLAREQLVAATAGNSELIDVDETELQPRLLLPGSAFISLSRDGELRGCMIDAFEEHEPLYRNVLRNTVLAARDDERFPPVTPEEVGGLRISVSVVAPPEPLAFHDPEDLLPRLDPGLDGVILTADGAMAAYLPDVWERFPDPEDFLGHLCEKAGLSADRWRQEPYPAIETFRVFGFEEG